MKKAGEQGTLRSFDLNYRSKVEPDKQKAHGINRRIVAETDFLVGNQGDFSDALGYETAAEKGVPFEEWLDAYADMLRVVAKDYQNLKLIGTNSVLRIQRTESVGPQFFTIPRPIKSIRPP